MQGFAFGNAKFRVQQRETLRMPIHSTSINLYRGTRLFMIIHPNK